MICQGNFVLILLYIFIINSVFDDTSKYFSTIYIRRIKYLPELHGSEIRQAAIIYHLPLKDSFT